MPTGKLDAIDYNSNAGPGSGPETAEQLKEKLRGNEDKLLTADELFNRYDRNGNNRLTSDEFVACLEQLGVRKLFPGDAFDKKVRQCMRKFDKDKSGCFDREEFLKLHNWLVQDGLKVKKKKKKKKNGKKGRKAAKETAEGTENQNSSSTNNAENASNTAEVAAVSEEEKQKQKEREQAIVKQHVTGALNAVREVLTTEKGQQILGLETRVLMAKDQECHVTTSVSRKQASDPLGLSFVIPPRIMAIGWASRPFVVVSGGEKMKAHKLLKGDIVVGCDNQEIATIEDLQKASKGKTEMMFDVVRIPDVTSQQLEETQRKVEKSLKSAVKAQVKQQLAEAKKTKANAM